MDVQTGLFEGKLLLQLLRSLDVPHAEDLADIQKIILIAVLGAAKIEGIEAS